MINQDGLSNRMIGSNRINLILGQQAIANELGISVSTVIKLKESGGFPVGKIGGQIFTTRQKLNNWVENQISG